MKPRPNKSHLDSQARSHDDLAKSGASISEESFRKQLGVTDAQFAAMLSDERVFSVEVDGQKTFPAIFCSSSVRLDRLWKIARIIAPAPAALRLDFLTTACGALEGRVPVDMLDDDRNYKQLRAYARAWASEFSRTSVVVWDADTLDDLSLAKPLYTCSTAVNPRRPLWRRALGAIHSPGYTNPVDIPQAPSSLVIVVERAMAGQSNAVPEAGFVCYLRGRFLRLMVHASNGAEITHELEMVMQRPSVIDVADALFSLLAKMNCSADLATGKSPTEKGAVAGIERPLRRNGR
ncbi:hypothetical protein [Caballeronia sp. LZ019]|uniref:hypothetical protein n=1 Tax=Caballeronia sp. LZ019 TaxID=3038555 RepID=UPI00285F9C93|nr:hypothetical protein [Caballeronia sp. LZ019]MDR5810627.1 hypothetical protein [Caballeronia sp. LZ019]